MIKKERNLRFHSKVDRRAEEMFRSASAIVLRVLALFKAIALKNVGNLVKELFSAFAECRTTVVLTPQPSLSQRWRTRWAWLCIVSQSKGVGQRERGQFHRSIESCLAV